MFSSQHLCIEEPGFFTWFIHLETGSWKSVRGRIPEAHIVPPTLSQSLMASF